MGEWLEAFYKLGGFALIYWTGKYMRSLAAGLFLIPFLLAFRSLVQRVRRRLGKIPACVDFYSMLFLLPMAWMGMNKLFYTTPAVFLTMWIDRLSRPLLGLVVFGVMGILAVGAFHPSVALAKNVHGLKPFSDRTLCLSIIESLTAKDRLPVGRRRLERVRVYVTGQSVSPVSGGVARPFILLPEHICTAWDTEELGAVLCHEYLHIKSGHIVWMGVFAFLRIYWWCNPLIYVCERILRQDMEFCCDEGSMYYAGLDGAGYGRLLLSMASAMQERPAHSVAAFAGQGRLWRKGGYRVLRERILRLSPREDKKCFVRRQRISTCIMASALVCSGALVLATSYPRYTVLPEIVMYDEKLNMLDNGSNELMEAVSVSRGRLAIDEERFEKILEKHGIGKGYVYLSFDTIMKVPGVGGGGNTGMVNVEDYSDIFYLAAETPENEVMVFCLKYL